jgi:hypothetical protein
MKLALMSNPMDHYPDKSSLKKDPNESARGQGYGTAVGVNSDLEVLVRYKQQQQQDQAGYAEKHKLAILSSLHYSPSTAPVNWINNNSGKQNRASVDYGSKQQMLGGNSISGVQFQETTTDVNELPQYSSALFASIAQNISGSPGNHVQPTMQTPTSTILPSTSSTLFDNLMAWANNQGSNQFLDERLRSTSIENLQQCLPAAIAHFSELPATERDPFCRPIQVPSFAEVQEKRNSINISTTSQRASHGPVELYIPGDDDAALSQYQCFIRKQMEFFEATPNDVAPGRKKPITLGQVGIRCKHCAPLPSKYRSRGTTYFPTKKGLIYQAAQNLATIHFHQKCHNMPEKLQVELSKLRKTKSSTGGGLIYWDQAATAVGVYETSNGLSFTPQYDLNSIPRTYEN